MGEERGTSTAAPAPPAARLRVSPAVPTGRAWAALRNENYRLYFFGQLVSQTGGWLQRVAQAWLVLDLTGSPAALGVVTALQFLPITLLTLVAGVLVDRVPRLRLVIALQAVATIQALALAAVVLSGTVQLWHVYVLALVFGVISAFDLPARQAFVAELVPRSQIQSAVGLNSTVFNGARIAGPGLGGVVIAAWGVGWCFALNGLSYMAVLWALARMRADRLYPVSRPARASLATQLGDGLRYAARTPELALPLLLLAVIGTFGYNFTVTLPLLARYALDVGSTGFGAMNAAIGAGSLVGSLVVVTRVAASRTSRLVAAASFAVLLGAVALVPWYGLVVVLLVGLGVASVSYSTVTNATLQLASHEQYRGRVLSLYTLLFAGTTPIGGAITGVLADAWGIRAAVTIEAGVCLAAVLVGWLYVRRAASSR